MAAFVHTGGSEKVTINGEKVKNKMNLVYEGVIVCEKVSTPPEILGGEKTTPAAVNYRGEIHLLGGTVTLNTGESITNGHFKYSDGEWIQVGTLPYSFSGAGQAVVYRDEIHIFGAASQGEHRKYHYRWDGDKWKQCVWLPDIFQFRSAVVYNDEIYILGVTNSNKLYKWNSSSDSWIVVTTMPHACAKGFAVVCSDGIHVLDIQSVKSKEYSHYLWDGSVWKAKPDLPNIVEYTHAATVNDIIFLLGGNVYNPDGSGTILTSTDSVYNIFDVNKDTWYGGNAQPTSDIQHGCAVAVGNEIHQFGKGTHRIIGKTLLKEV